MGILPSAGSRDVEEESFVDEVEEEVEQESGSVEKMSQVLSSSSVTNSELCDIMSRSMAALKMACEEAGSGDEALHALSSSLLRSLKVWSRKSSEKPLFWMLEALCLLTTTDALDQHLSRTIAVLFEIALNGSAKLQEKATEAAGRLTRGVSSAVFRAAVLKEVSSKPEAQQKISLAFILSCLKGMDSQEVENVLTDLLPYLQQVLKGGLVANRKGAVECVVEAAFVLGLKECSGPLAGLGPSQKKLVQVYLKKRMRVSS